MPIFDYTCKSCGNSFEKMVKTSSAVVECSKCGGTSEKVISAPRESGLVLKGEGFYKKSPSSW